MSDTDFNIFSSIILHTHFRACVFMLSKRAYKNVQLNPAGEKNI